MDSDEEYESNTSLWKGIPATIVLVNLFQNAKYNTFAVAHAAICRLIKHYLRTSSSQNLSLCIYGIEESKTSVMDIKSLVEIFPLTTPTVDDFKKVMDIHIRTFTESKDLVMSDVLWHCSKMFANCKRQLSSRTIVILSPFHLAPTETDKRPSLKRVEDLVDSNVDFKLINVCENETAFDPFYDKFLMFANKGMSLVRPVPLYDPLEIERLMIQESHRHLAIAKIDFEVSKDIVIAVGIYSLMKQSEQSYHKTTNLDRETNAIVSSVTKTMKVFVDTSEDDSQTKELPILKSEIIYYQEYGGERIEFSEKELKSLKNPFGPPKLKLLGFKPENLVCKEKWFLKMSYFLFPNESSIEGSTVAFKAMYKACLEMSVVAICILCTRVNARPVTVALKPSTNLLHLNKVEIGFDVIQIPFAEHIRDIDINEEEIVRTDRTNKILMKDTLNDLTFDYKPEMFQNPKLQSEYKYIEEKALDSDDTEPFIDTTKPNADKFQNIKDDLFEEFFGPFQALSLKRVAPTASSGNNKKPKVELSDSLLQSRIKDGTVDAYNVQQLKDILKQKNDLPALTGLKKKNWWIWCINTVNNTIISIYQYYEYEMSKLHFLYIK